jgi:hypothetical protein
VVQLDQMTQQNAALVEESAAAAESLKQQAATLAKAVGTFKLDAAMSAVLSVPASASSAPGRIQARGHQASAEAGGKRTGEGCGQSTGKRHVQAGAPARSAGSGRCGSVDHAKRSRQGRRLGNLLIST